MTAYERVVLTNHGDHQKVFKLLVDCIKSPEYAAALKEIVFDTELQHQEPPAPEKFLAKIAQLDEGDKVALLQGAISKLGLDEAAAADWLKILRTGSPGYKKAYRQTVSIDLFVPENPSHPDYLECAAVVLLSTCPNITSFVYGDRGIEGGPLQGFLRKNNYSLLPEQFLQKLRHVTILESKEYADDRFYTEMDFLGLLRLFHRLPALQTVSVDAVYIGELDCREKFPPGTSDIKEMHIKHSAYPTSFLGAAIRIPRALRVLSLTTGRRGISDGSVICGYPMTIGKALLSHRTTLRELHIDLDEYFADLQPSGPGEFEDTPDSDYEDEAEQERDEWWQRDMEITTESFLRTWHIPNTREYGLTIGSLHDFSALTHLRIGVLSLLGSAGNSDGGHFEAHSRLIDILPPRLEHLTLYGYVKGENSYLDGQVEEFMQLKSDRLPELKEVHGIETTVPRSKNLDEEEFYGEDKDEDRDVGRYGDQNGDEDLDSYEDMDLTDYLDGHKDVDSFIAAHEAALKNEDGDEGDDEDETDGDDEDGEGDEEDAMDDEEDDEANDSGRGFYKRMHIKEKWTKVQI